MARPVLPWLTPTQLGDLPPGTAVAVETTGRHVARTLGRISSMDETHLYLRGPAGPVTLKTIRVRRGRVVPGLYEPGDPVLRPGVSATEWRGGVVRLEGREVLVEDMTGGFAWLGEDDLEPAEARDHQPANAPL